MFQKLLIANRGEIACRIIETARRMGVATVAVYSDADAGARHVRLADEAVRIGAAPAAESYLNIDAVVLAGQVSGADAVHPGYGFLAENAVFADAVTGAGMAFIGPPADAIRAMGSKATAKQLMEKAGVPLVPGYHGAKQDDATMRAKATGIGYPLLVKATAGGGGKGMRVVDRPASLKAALSAAKREAKSAFGDARLLLERYFENARHVEVQVFADTQGHCIHLFERDCSAQRRHQKVVEEAPAPGMTKKLRHAMGKAAVAAAQAVNYVGAGTVEFLLAADSGFHFLEMNTRLQVEHPVTELITGLDLVEWQLRVAAGEPLPLGQGDVEIAGHAVEVRLYAEDPDAGFLPQTGILDHLHFPEEAPDARIDTGVETGDAVSVHYDPMLAKVIAHGADREAACNRLAAMLAEVRLVGLKTNLDFLLALLADEAFRKGGIDTAYLEVFAAGRAFSRERPATASDAFVVACDVVKQRRVASIARAAAGHDPHSPWFDADGWRLNDRGWQDVVLASDDDGAAVEWPVRVRAAGDALTLSVDGAVARDEDVARLGAHLVWVGDAAMVFRDGGRARLALVDRTAAADNDDMASGGLTAPMPGRIVAVEVTKGQRVDRGDALVVLEAMKMEHTVAAPADGTVAEVAVSAGDQVEEGMTLVTLEAPEADQ